MSVMSSFDSLATVKKLLPTSKLHAISPTLMLDPSIFGLIGISGVVEIAFRSESCAKVLKRISGWTFFDDSCWNSERLLHHSSIWNLKLNQKHRRKHRPSHPHLYGYLVILDKEAQTYSFFGLVKNNSIHDLPFPQNKDLIVDYSSDGEESMFVPVLNQPLSSNRYYVIRRRGKDQGKASTSSKEEDMETCLCCSIVNDVKPRPLEPFNDYQQVEVIKKSHGFHAKSLAPDGIPPGLLRNKGWTVRASTPHNYHLGKALGSNDSLRSLLPDFNSFPLSNDTSQSVVVGKWYSPFMFVKEQGMKVKKQMKMSVFYELTLEQRWEKIFSKEIEDDVVVPVLVDVVVQTEVAKVGAGRRDAVWDENSSVVNGGVLWFKSFDGVGAAVGLSLEVVEGMKWEQERVGWVGGNERQVRVERVEEFGGRNVWRKFSCYVLVESFVLKRMDRSLVLTYDYRHTHQIRCKWE